MKWFIHILSLSLVSFVLASCFHDDNGNGTTTYTIGGSVTGLEGSGLTLQNNSSNNLAITTDGNFVFSTRLASGSSYNVTVLTQPNTPSQTCTVTNGSGSVANSNITNVTITCITNTFTVGGLITGLSGGNLVLQNNGADNLTITGNGSFVFTTALADTTAYSATILTQPISPSQTCIITNGSGTITSNNVTNITVTCAINTFTIGGTVTGLSGNGLVLQNKTTDNLSITGNGDFVFATALADTTAYSVTVLTQPNSPSQGCTVTDGSGNLAGSDITNVTISCVTNTFTIGGTVTGLSGGNLVLQNNATDNLSITGNGDFVFSTALADLTTYSVSVLTQPGSPSQDCTVTDGSGTLAGSNITNVTITCVTNTFTIGGTVTGLGGSGLVLQNNGTDDLTVTTDSFTFATAITDGDSYEVTVLNHPTSPSQTCTVNDGSGTVNGANITNVTVSCVINTFSIGGAVSGMTGTGLVLQNNLSDNLSITTGGSFTFATEITDGDSYGVTVLTQPGGQYCTVLRDNGMVNGADITSVSVECMQTYTNASLNGDYLFTTTEIHNPGSGMTYCGLSGTLNFNGAGTLEVTSGTKRCSEPSGVTTSDITGATMSYSVNADGSFSFGSPPMHGQILLDGNSLLLDGTLKESDPGDYLDRGIAMKRVTTGSPPTYDNTSLNDAYLFNFAEIYEPANVTFCNEAATLNLTGDGNGSTSNGLMRCSDGVTITNTSSSDSIFYSVASDGSFTLSDQISDPQPLHGQITLDGNGMLMDTSLSVSGGAHLMDLVAMKRVSSGSAPTYNNASLQGDYKFIYTEIYDPGNLNYCDQAGTLSFDGAGKAQGSGRSRCSNGTTVTTTSFSDMLEYDVAPDGSFTLGGPDEPLHGQIVLDNTSLLLDGTMMETSITRLFSQGIAMKRIADELFGTWSLCRNEGSFDEKEIHTFDGAAGTATSYLYSSTDGSCSTGQTFNSTVSFTYTTGEMITTSLSGNSVNAIAIDATFPGEGTFYQIYYIDHLSAPDHLYMGDETANPLRDGSTADKRPIALQETWPRLRQ